TYDTELKTVSFKRSPRALYAHSPTNLELLIKSDVFYANGSHQYRCFDEGNRGYRLVNKFTHQVGRPLKAYIRVIDQDVIGIQRVLKGEHGVCVRSNQCAGANLQ